MLSDTEAHLALYAKLHKIAQAITHVEKGGHNDFQNYDYVRAVDVVRDLRKQLLDNGIIVLAGASDVRHLPYGSKGGHLTTVDLDYTFVDIETGAKINVPWAGVGTDNAGDKGIYKAFTGGLKYMLTTTFLIPSSDDPERDQLTQPESQEEPAPPAQHKDDARPAAPVIPRDRAVDILRRATNVGMATLDLDAAPGTAPEFHAAFKAALALQGVSKIGELNVDSAEAIEAWLTNEETHVAELPAQ